MRASCRWLAAVLILLAAPSDAARQQQAALRHHEGGVVQQQISSGEGVQISRSLLAAHPVSAQKERHAGQAAAQRRAGVLPQKSRQLAAAGAEAIVQHVATADGASAAAAAVRSQATQPLRGHLPSSGLRRVLLSQPRDADSHPSSGTYRGRSSSGNAIGLRHIVLARSGRGLRQNAPPQRRRVCRGGSGCMIAFSLVLAGAVCFLCGAACCFCCCKRNRQQHARNVAVTATAARVEAGDPAEAAAEIVERQLISKIAADHAMAGVECPICLDTPCEVVLPCGHGSCHLCVDKLIARAARLTTCPMCRKRILPPALEPVVVVPTAGDDGGVGVENANGGEDEDGGAARGGSGGWRRLLRTPPHAWQGDWPLADAWRDWWRSRERGRLAPALAPAGAGAGAA